MFPINDMDINGVKSGDKSCAFNHWNMLHGIQAWFKGYKWDGDEVTLITD